MSTDVRLTGKVKFYNEAKGYGFVIVDHSNEEIFIHGTELKDTINKGDYVQFGVKETKKGRQAISVQLL